MRELGDVSQKKGREVTHGKRTRTSLPEGTKTLDSFCLVVFGDISCRKPKARAASEAEPAAHALGAIQKNKPRRLPEWQRPLFISLKLAPSKWC